MERYRVADRGRLHGLLRIFALVCIFLSGAVAVNAQGAVKSLTIIASPQVLENPVAKTTVEDTLRLLQEGFPSASVALNNRTAEVQLILPVTIPPGETTILAGCHSTPRLPYPDHGYEWRSTGRGGRIFLTLQTPSPQGISCALYGLLQERLGFRFYHPKRTLIPRRSTWPLPARFHWQATSRFDKKGFHLHTLHPIELTAQLHDPGYPHALADVKEYVDWLARNQQNVMQFYLLRGIDRDRWIDHARAIVDYAHRRGVLAGVEISVAMLQQQAFQAVTLLRPWPSYRRQIDRTLDWLFQAPWDFVTVEPTMGEWLPDLAGLRPGLTDYILRAIAEHHHAKALLATHVIRGRGFLGQTLTTQAAVAYGAGAEERPPAAGLLLHSVMCYSVSEAKAPVYGNGNQRFVLERAKREAGRREVWYWPESAYWVAFDNSVPLFLLPYLDARWSDMAAMELVGVRNHLTFSSGWEWGYWLVDWSIARWSWRYRYNGTAVPTAPLAPLRDLFPGPGMARLWREALELQNYYLKERELLRYMAALTPFSELPRSISRPFQPEPAFTRDWLLHDATAADVEKVVKGPVTELDAYGEKMERIVAGLRGEAHRLRGDGKQETTELKLLAGELTRALEVTALRARHRVLTIRALIARRRDAPSGQGSRRLLAEAEAVRARAQELVRRQEAIYRYPIDLIARKRESLTAYPFGYLYPVSDLYFWRREEEQVRHERFDPFFMNIWDFWRTVGLSSLF
jgi:hypothetical protein